MNGFKYIQFGQAVWAQKILGLKRWFKKSLVKTKFWFKKNLVRKVKAPKKLIKSKIGSQKLVKIFFVLSPVLL